MNEAQNIEFLTYKHEIREKLRSMIDDWESRVPAEEDDTLYTLALRRALDVVDGVDVDLGP
jgi:hypothetical protein